MDIITVCMGSSCFGRGNSSTAKHITRFLNERNLTAKIEVSGCLCDENCEEGPIIKINRKLISGVSEETIEKILIKELGLDL